MLNKEVFYSINTVMFEGCGRNKNMNIECHLLRFKLTISQPASTELQNTPQYVFAIFIGIGLSVHFLSVFGGVYSVLALLTLPFRNRVLQSTY